MMNWTFSILFCICLGVAILKTSFKVVLSLFVVIFSQDTFLLRDPTERFQAAADDWDALFARHGDGDCINIGIFYLKAPIPSINGLV